MTVADLTRRYDPDQLRDPDGKWGDGVPGPSAVLGRLRSEDGLDLEVSAPGDGSATLRFPYPDDAGDQFDAVTLPPESVTKLKSELGDLEPVRKAYVAKVQAAARRMDSSGEGTPEYAAANAAWWEIAGDDQIIGAGSAPGANGGTLHWALTMGEDEPTFSVAIKPPDAGPGWDLAVEASDGTGGHFPASAAPKLRKQLDKADIARNYDPSQHRGYHGRWADGAPGISLNDYADMYDVYDETPTSSGLLVATMNNGEMQLAFDDPEHPDRRMPLLDIDERDMLDVRHAVQQVLSAGGERELDDGGDVWLRVADEGDGISVEIPGEEYSAVLDDDETGELLEALDEQLGRVDEVGRSGVLERRYNPLQKRDGDGQWSDGTPGQSARDALKLAGKIELAPDEKLIASGKVDGDQAGVRMALTEHGGRRMLRLGVGGDGYGKADRDTGTPAWDGNHARTQLPEADRQRLDAEFDALDEEYDTASPARQAEISARQDEIKELLPGPGDDEFNGTAKLDEYSMGRLADRIRPALAEAVEQNKAENDAWDEIEALEAQGNPDPARMATLRETARADSTDFITFSQGIIPGSEWGDVHYSVELDDPTMGATVRLGVWPKGAPDDWGSGREWDGQLDAAETRKFLRLLDKMNAADASRAHSQESGPVYQAPAGPPAGGQFAAGGGRVGAKGRKKPAPRRPAAHHGSAKPAAPNPNLSFDGKSGTGYGVKGGDPRVRQLQAVLNRLGLADSSGAALVLDGKYGPRTTSSVKKLQKALGIAQDGKVTPELLKQATELKQLPAKPARKPAAKKTATSARQAPARRAQVLAYLARALGEEHVYDDGVCVSCWLDRIDELTTALDELTMSRSWDSGAHPRNPKGAGGGRFRSNVDKLKDALKSHKASGGAGDPFEGFDREQLRRVAKQRGIELGRGEDRDSIAKKLMAHLGEDGGDAGPKTEPKAAVVKSEPKKHAPRKKAAPKPAEPEPAAATPQAKALPSKATPPPEAAPAASPPPASVASTYTGPAFEYSSEKKRQLAERAIELQILDVAGTMRYGTPDRRRLSHLLENSGFTDAEIGHIRQQAVIQENLDQWRTNSGSSLSDTALKASAESRSREAWDGKPIALRVTPKALTGILAAGRVKSQFETGTSKGLLDKTTRADAEAKWFGIGEHSDPKKRPIYGYVAVEGIRPVGSEDDEALSQYGRIQVVLKDSVRSRTTAMWGDSLNQQHLGMPEPVDAPTWRSYSLAGRGGIANGELDSLDRDVTGDRWRQWSYVEAQIHDGVSTGDIAEVVLPAKPTASLKKALDAAGIPWRTS